MIPTRFELFWSEINKYQYESVLKYHQLKTGFAYANGCGAKGGINVPDTMYGVNVTDACNMHDIEWANAQCMADLLIANKHFDNNLKKKCDRNSNWLTKRFRRVRIFEYVFMVKIFGTKSYARERGFIA